MSTPSVTFSPTPAVLSKHFDIEQQIHPTFAFAKLQGNICLIQLVSQAGADASGTPLLDIDVFRHEFVSMFRYSHSARVHPLELRVLEPLDDHAVRYEPVNGSLFVAKDLMGHLKRILDAAATGMFNRTGRRSRQRS